MKARCTVCGEKLRKDDEVCRKCGHEVYQSIYGDIAGEVEADLEKVTQNDIDTISKETYRRALSSGAYKDKLTREEFEQIYLKTHRKPSKLILSRSAAWAAAKYEKDLTRAYNEYLRGIGYDI